MEIKKLCNLLEYRVNLPNESVEPVEPVHMNVHQSNTYRKQVSWLPFDRDQRV